MFQWVSHGTENIGNHVDNNHQRANILLRHVLHNALPPVIPRLGLQFSTMLTLAMITEMVFS